MNSQHFMSENCKTTHFSEILIKENMLGHTALKIL